LGNDPFVHPPDSPESVRLFLGPHRPTYRIVARLTHAVSRKAPASIQGRRIHFRLISGYDPLSASAASVFQPVGCDLADKPPTPWKLKFCFDGTGRLLAVESMPQELERSGPPAASPRAVSRRIRTALEDVRGRKQGLMSLTILALRARANRLDPARTPQGYVEGIRPSAASCLYDTLDGKLLAWHDRIFGGPTAFRRCVRKSIRTDRSADGLLKKVFVVRLNEEHLAPEHVLVEMDARPASAGELVALADALEREYWRHTPVVPAPEARPPSPPPGQSVRVTVLLSGDLAYTRQISGGLAEGLDESGKAAGIRFEVDARRGPKGPPEDAVWDDLIRAVRGAARRGPLNYNVAVGTQAAIALLRHKPEDPSPLIFLGVTHPVEVGLVGSFTGRSDSRPIAGVAYGPGVREIAARVVRLFPDRRQVFAYRADIPQDRYAADSLRDTPMFRAPAKTLWLKEIPANPTAGDLNDPHAVYFSWYTFEMLFEEARGQELLRGVTAVATTKKNVADGLAVAGASADDWEIGRSGAEMIVRHASEPDAVRLGHLDVQVPAIRYWINRRVAAERGITFPDEVMSGAAEIFD
jgi:ABC-type uncharacterized transport system substrate-binding protein